MWGNTASISWGTPLTKNGSGTWMTSSPISGWTGKWPSPISNRNLENSISSTGTCIFCFNCTWCTFCHKQEHRTQAWTILAWSPLLTTGRIWQGSPPNTTVRPPNGMSHFKISLSMRSTPSICCTLLMRTSSQTIIVVMHISWASVDCREMAHTDSSETGMGILKWECAVHPPDSSSAAIPDEATANAIFPIPQTVAKAVSNRNVFPQPPGALMKKSWGETFRSATAWRICCSTSCCSLFNIAFSCNAFTDCSLLLNSSSRTTWGCDVTILSS